MVLFSNKKKLAEARLEQERLQFELAQSRREREREQNRRFAQEERQTQEAQRQRQEAERREQERILQDIERREREEVLRQYEEQLAVVRQQEAEEEAKFEREQQQLQAEKKRMKEASPETLRSLRGLIRSRYQLDIEIWSLRGARRPNRHLVEQKMERADAVLDEIHGMVDTWGDNSEGTWTPKEWEKVQQIKQRLKSDGQRIWANNPPWAET